MLGKILRRRIKHGRLTIIRPDGQTEQFGELTAAKPCPDVAVRLKGALTSLKLSLHPDLYFGELYVDGALIMERGTLWDLLELLGRNQLEQRSVPGNSVIGPLQAFLGWMRRGDSRRAARRHVAHHYDLPHEHYGRFLDADLQYSCAYFADPSFSLAQAQEAKKRHIAAKLVLEPGLRVLDIGCGWGGLALSLAERERVEVVGVTLSREQLTVARKRAKQARLEERVRFALQDYREIEGRFDRSSQSACSNMSAPETMQHSSRRFETCWPRRASPSSIRLAAPMARLSRVHGHESIFFLEDTFPLSQRLRQLSSVRV